MKMTLYKLDASDALFLIKLQFKVKINENQGMVVTYRNT